MKLSTVLAVSLMLLANIVEAKGSSHSSSYKVTDNTVQSSMIPYPAISRVMHFESSKNAISDEGIIVVCPRSFKLPDRPDKPCTAIDGKIGWVNMADVNIPGHKLVGFEYRFIGVGQRQLFLYFEAVK